MLLLGIDIGTSSVKVSVLDAATGKKLCSVSHPETEREITALQAGWAEQSPQRWWSDVQYTIAKANASNQYDPKNIAAIGITYQMHGLVCVDKNQEVLRDAIIWCDSRAVEIGNKAFETIGEEKCLSRLLNSPGNFTASKLAWVKEHEPAIYEKIDKIMLPGDYIAMKLTGEVTTSASALSEGIFWDFKSNQISGEVMEYFGFAASIIPPGKDVFGEHGRTTKESSSLLGLTAGIPVAYKAGDQPNNALSLQVLKSGEVAATAGTSGVIYAVNDKLGYDPQSRVNSFAHVNHTANHTSIGTLLCINGAGFSYSAVKKKYAGEKTYAWMNDEAAKVEAALQNLFFLPFGNGAERMLNNKSIGSKFINLDEDKHGAAHIFRAVQEGIAFAFRYGLDILKENGIQPAVIRAGHANMFLSEGFTSIFASVLDVPVELYENDGSAGAAIGAGIGAGIYPTPADAFSNFKPLKTVQPVNAVQYNELYLQWRSILLNHLNT